MPFNDVFHAYLEQWLPDEIKDDDESNKKENPQGEATRARRAGVHVVLRARGSLL